MSVRSAAILARLRGRRLYASTLGRILPSGCYVVDLSGLDEAAVFRHLRRCCGSALCCSEDIADMMESQS